MPFGDFSDPLTLEFYYLFIFLIFGYLLYWFGLRSGYVVHIMNPVGNTYKEIRKKKFSYKYAYRDITFLDKTKNIVLGKVKDGRSYILDPSFVSYIHWRNQHIFYQIDGMIGMKLMLPSGKWNPSSKSWYDTWYGKIFQTLVQGSIIPPQKAGYGRFTIVIVFIISFLIGYFVALTYGNILSPALGHGVTTTVTSSTSTATTTQTTITTHIP